MSAVDAKMKQWIVENAEHGCTPESMLESMIKGGHNSRTARRMLATVLGAVLPDTEVAQPTEPGQRLTVPNPADGVTTPYIRTSDRKVDILATLGGGRIIVFGGVLSDEECDSLIAFSAKKLERSRTVNRETGEFDEHQDRISDGTYFMPDENPLIQRIDRRIAELVRWPADRGEGLQILRYDVGGEYKPHYDYFDPTDPGSAPMVAKGGQRVATLVTYLHSPEAGGATVFPDISFEVAAVRGNAVFFSYDQPSPESFTLHAGAPVIKGVKWIATKWMRERTYR